MTKRLHLVFSKEQNVSILDLLSENQKMIPSVLFCAILPDFKTEEEVEDFDRWCQRNHDGGVFFRG